MIAKRALAFVILLGLSCAALTQDKTVSDKTQTAQQKTIVGCLTGYDGHYTIGTSNDMLFLLNGDSASFKPLNAKMVRATGIVSEPAAATSKHNVLSQQPPTMKVIAVKKIADGCN